MQLLRRVRDALSSARRGSLSSAAIDGAPAPKISDDLLHGIFLKTAARHPDRIAIRLIDPSPEAARKSELTYKELFERASHFAHYLVLNGVKRGDRVVICLPRGLDQYMAVLGTLLAGAAYVPADYSLPLERLRHIIGDSAAAAVVIVQDRKCGLEDVGAAIVAIDGVLGEIAAPALALPVAASPVGDDLAYIIYTSGSTGVPKGAMICHRNIAFQVRAEGEVLKLTEEDVVYAGASLAFDVSVEEMWAAFLVGAVLLVGSEGLAKNLDELPARLHANRATVWCPVPSLLAAVDHPLPMIRLINAGGEAFPPALVRRWAVGSRRLINTYGPTETAVTVTFAELSPGLPVTIGKPLRGVSIWIVDEKLAPVKPGEEGELLIGGPTVGKGYLNDPALTGKKFVAITVPAGRKERAYRTGDLVREDANGDLIFCGRIDLQVKIRGYRVELGEIENVIAHDNAVAQVAVKFFDEPGQPQMLAAFVTPRQQSLIIIDRLRGLAAQHLPDYMRPATYVVASSLPVLISGKIDRRALARVHLPAMDEAPAAQAPETPCEAKLLEVWKTIFTPMPVSTTDNFFETLGGHSLLAVRMVSMARNDPEMRSIAVRDLYAAPTVRELAARLATRQAATDAEPAFFSPIPPLRYLFCATGQAVAAIFIFAFSGIQWLLPYLVYTTMATNAASRLPALFAAAAAFMAMPPITLLLSVAMKWIIIGRFKAGEYPLWGFYYFRWWLVRRLLNAVPTIFLAGTPFMALYFRLLGAKVGADVFLQTNNIDAPDLVSIGDRAIVGRGAALASSSVERGVLRLGWCRIGVEATVGTMAVLGYDTAIGARAALEDLSALTPGENIPPGDVWGGSPASPRGRAAMPIPRAAPPGSFRRWGITALLLVAIGILPLVAVLPIAPGLIGMMELDWMTNDYMYIALSPVLALIYIVSMCLLTVAIKWALLGRVKAGVYSLWSWFYLRFCFVEKLNELSLDILHPLFATLYLAPWYRALGASIGARAEISTATSVVHDLVDIGQEGFIADGVEFGAGRAGFGGITLAPTKIGRRCFIGNSALIPTASALPDEVLIGVLSRPPKQSEMEKGSTWFGSPPIRLPNRQVAVQFSEGARFKPSPRLVAIRLAIEYVRVTLPLTIFIALFCMLLTVVGDLSDLPNGAWWIFGTFPLLYLAFVVMIGGAIISMKWMVVGRYRPTVAPLWSMFVWRTELVTSAYENLVVPLLLEPLRGTPYINMFFRLMGCRIGKRVFTDTTDMTEFDLIAIGDDAALNEDAGLQTHLFEDRVMKVSRISIANRATVGSRTIILYDSVMEDDSSLGDLSVLMKGEVLPAGTAWEGSPAKPAPRR